MADWEIQRYSSDLTYSTGSLAAADEAPHTTQGMVIPFIEEILELGEIWRFSPRYAVPRLQRTAVPFGERAHPGPKYNRPRELTCDFALPVDSGDKDDGYPPCLCHNYSAIVGEHYNVIYSRIIHNPNRGY